MCDASEISTLTMDQVTQLISQAKSAGASPLLVGIQMFNNLGENVTLLGPTLALALTSGVPVDPSLAPVLSAIQNISKAGTHVNIRLNQDTELSLKNTRIKFAKDTSFDVSDDAASPALINIVGLAGHKLFWVNVQSIDPVHTHLAFFFDRQIDAIQEAVQQDGYLFARSYMPWDPNEHSEDTDFRTRLAQDDYRSEREAYPGLMIFRDDRGTSDFRTRRHLFVFVVGETPTGGINKSQYQWALEAIRAICGKDRCKSSRSDYQQSLYVLGPTFSGSLYSLALLLRDRVDEVENAFSDVVINTGTATDERTIYWFTQFISDRAQNGSLNIHFRAFQENSNYALVHFLDLACHYGYQSKDVAVLSEDQTAYGSAYINYGSSAATNSCVDQSRVIQLYFPRDIAQLRAAYQQSLQQQSSSCPNNPTGSKIAVWRMSDPEPELHCH
jgi:hypothetical protein